MLSDLDTGDLLLSSLSARTTFARRDDPVFLSDGYEVKLDSRLSSAALGSEADFFSIGAQTSWARPLPDLSRRFSVGARVYGASSWPFGGTDEIPITERYYLGGRTTVRGFKENSLGPRGEQGSIIGGDLAASASIELRYLIYPAVTARTFVDAGNMWLRDRGIDTVRESAGAGMLYLSPVGAIGIDVGVPLDRQDGESSFRVHLVVGGIF